jgi:glucose/arabinose dehydrogenase
VRRLGGAAVAALALALGACGGDTAPSPSPTPDAGGCSAGDPVEGTPPLTTTAIVTGLDSPLDVQAPTGDPRLFIVERSGRIRIVKGGQLLATPFLDLSSRITSGGEQGLLGLAFHPQYAQNGRFYVNYTNPSGNSRIAEFHASGDPDAADAGSERVLLAVQQPFANHNGGGLAFGNDGMLYAGLGDGGSAGDPLGNGQDLGTHLGKMLRLDVEREDHIPTDNPFVGTSGALPEIWAFGLRNPWRFAFDSATGDLYIGDVGQDAHEEIDIGLPGHHGGENYGWNVMEGDHCYNSGSCNRTGLTLPVLEYGHDAGCAVTGGVVYHGCRMPGYAGTYFYGDYCSHFVRSFRFQGGQVSEHRDWANTLGQSLTNLSSFGTDGAGEIYLVDLTGAVYKVVPAS